MTIKILSVASLFFILIFTSSNAQKFERSRPKNIKEQILIKLDSIDLIYFSSLRTREKFEARRKLDNIVMLVDKLEDQIKEKENEIMERERMVSDREKEMLSKERERDLDHNRNRDRDRDHDKDRDRQKEDIRISPINLQEFDQLIQSIERTAFDQDKKKIIRTSSMNNYFLVDQVIKIAAKFSFDNDKLDIIEVLYLRILDQDKNYMLYNCFTFSDSKNKLENFIMEQNKKR